MLSLLLFACTKVPDPQGDTGATDDGIPSGDALVADTVPVTVSSEPCDACGGDCLLEQLAYDKRYHTTEPIAYASTPPAGGPHNPCWAVWGIHDEPVLDDNFVHNLEHGGVVFAYSDDALQGEVDALATKLGDYMFTTPYTQQKSAMTAVAWGWRLSLGCFDESLLSTFYTQHVNQGPESLLADPSAGCM
jgi:Protein of unknown function (DUF3105)